MNTDLLDQITAEWVDAFVFRIFNTCQCPKCGPRLKSKGEVIAQKEGFICTSCNTLTQSEEMEIPF